MSLPRLLQLASPALPTGAYSYPQGLEAAVEAGIVADAATAERWIGDVLELAIATLEAPLLARMLSQPGRVGELNELFLATRETAELRAETAQMGHSLRLLLSGLGAPVGGAEEYSYPAAFAQAALGWELDPKDALVAYLWSWLENQVLAAVKVVPLGQTDGQRILSALAARLPAIAESAFARSEDEWCNFAPGLALLSARHETQYSRLFRS